MLQAQLEYEFTEKKWERGGDSSASDLDSHSRAFWRNVVLLTRGASSAVSSHAKAGHR